MAEYGRVVDVPKDDGNSIPVLITLESDDLEENELAQAVISAVCDYSLLMTFRILVPGDGEVTATATHHTQEVDESVSGEAGEELTLEFQFPRGEIPKIGKVTTEIDSTGRGGGTTEHQTQEHNDATTPAAAGGTNTDDRKNTTAATAPAAPAAKPAASTAKPTTATT